MFLSTNDNIALWFKVYCKAHLMAPNHVINPAWVDDIFYVNDNRRKLKIWPSDPVVQCAMTLETVACSYVSPEVLKYV